MKIKTKKQLNLPQLIEWAMANEIKHKIFQSNPNFDGVTYNLGFDKGGDLYFEEALSPTLIFTVEVEEEITEDTKLDLIVRFIGGMGYACYTSHGDITIKECLRRSPEECTTTHFYIKNDNRELVLTWRNGKLVEQMIPLESVVGQEVKDYIDKNTFRFDLLGVMASEQTHYS